jgi:CO/xanthine dehydrogenase FAD-binding subunit
MKIFDYVRPATVPEAVAAAVEPGSSYLAAGTNLLDLMKGGAMQPDRLVERHALAGPRPPGAPGRWRHAHRRAGAERRPRA